MSKKNTSWCRRSREQRSLVFGLFLMISRRIGHVVESVQTRQNSRACLQTEQSCGYRSPLERPLGHSSCRCPPGQKPPSRQECANPLNRRRLCRDQASGFDAIVAEGLIGGVMPAINCGNAVRRLGGYEPAAACQASAVSWAWYELRTSGPDSTWTKPRSSAIRLSSRNSSGW